MRTSVGVVVLLARALLRVLPHRARVARPVPAWRGPRPADTRSSAMRRTQLALGGAGVALLLWGGIVLLTSVSLTVPHYLGLLIWLGGAIVFHDVLLVPVVTLLRAGLGRFGGDLPRGGVGLVQGGFVVGAVLTLTTVPEIYAQSLSPGNPTVLPSDYTGRLVLTWVVIVGIVVIGNLGLLARDRLRSSPTPSARDHMS